MSNSNDSMIIPQEASAGIVNINGDEQSYENAENVPDPAGSISYATQTEEEDAVDSAIVLTRLYKNVIPTGLVTLKFHKDDGGFLSNLFTMVLPKRKKDESQTDAPKTSSGITTATQTEEQDPLTAQGQHMSYLVIQDLAIGNRVNSNTRDEVFETLCFCVSEILEKHSILFNGMVRRVEITQYHMFASVANELFEANSVNEMGQLRITWGRIVSLFAFAVRLVRENQEDAERLDYLTRYLATYVTKNIIPFVEQNGGWEGLVDQFPPPEDGDPHLRRAMVWSGLCVGLVATMYVSSLLK